MVSAWLVFRLVKWLGIAVFAAGLGLSVSRSPVRSRLFGGLGVATAGLFLTWMSGYGMMKGLDQSFREPHIAGALLASLVALLGGVLGGWLGSRIVPLALVVGGMASSIGFMTAGADPTALAVLGGVVPVVLAVGAAAVGYAMPLAEADRVAARAAVHTWFSWIARAEGVSLLVLFGVYMPLKYGAGIEIDGGQGWIGWVHGVLVFLYLLALGTGVFGNRWGLLAGALGFVASLLPFGTFVFEGWLGRRQDSRGPPVGQTSA